MVRCARKRHTILVAHQDRHFRRIKNVTGDPTEDHLPDTAAGISAFDQQIGVNFFRLFQYRFTRGTAAGFDIQSLSVDSIAAQMDRDPFAPQWNQR